MSITVFQMNFEHYSILISVLCAVILAFAWFINSYLNDSRQLKKLNEELKDVKNSGANIIHKIKENELRLAQEKEKLLMHIQASAEGICFFKPERTVDFYNGLFLQYFNIISHESLSVEREMLKDEVFAPVLDFLNHCTKEDYFETRITRQGNEFSLRANAFADKSFEIILTDITFREKTKRLKHEMTGNIAHELRTPVTSIRGFLEIILNNNIGEDKKKEYLQRMYLQIQTLSELISDMSLLAKIDGKAEGLSFDKVDINQLLEKVQADTATAMNEKGIRFNANIPKGLFVNGNKSLLYSIFRNLTDNAIRYAGENININVWIYEIKNGMAYFVFSDNGKGVKENIPPERLFERFFRVEAGRTRDTGGSGLGLSIVKNAVLFHKGTITARNGSAGGLEFMFSLPV